MPDIPTMPPAEPAVKDPFTIVPTLDGYLELERRVAGLEARVPGEDAVPADWQARLDRHRLELEELKRRYNALADLYRLHLSMFTGPQAPATVPESPL